MNKSYSPASIPTFYDGENMEEVRTKTINPLTQEVTRLGLKMNDLSLVSSSHANKISALESNGVDLTPITNRVARVEQEAENLDIRVDILETDKLDMQVAIGGLDGRVTTLEANGGGGGGGSTTFRGLTDTPSTLEANKYVKVNAAGTALEFASGGTGGGAATFTDLSDTPDTLSANHFLKINAAGDAIESVSPNFLTADSYVDSINIHGDFYIGPAGVFAKDRVASSTFLMAASGSSPVVNLPDMVAKNAFPAADQIRSGRIIHIIGFGSDMTVNSPANAAQKIWYNGAAVSQINVPGNGTLDLYAMHNGSFQNYIVIGGRNIP